MIRILLTQISTFGALFALSQGNAYMADGFGIHPIIAGALAVMLIATPYLVIRNMRDHAY